MFVGHCWMSEIKECYLCMQVIMTNFPDGSLSPNQLTQSVVIGNNVLSSSRLVI